MNFNFVLFYYFSIVFLWTWLFFVDKILWIEKLYRLLWPRFYFFSDIAYIFVDKNNSSFYVEKIPTENLKYFRSNSRTYSRGVNFIEKYQTIFKSGGQLVPLFYCKLNFFASSFVKQEIPMEKPYMLFTHQNIMLDTCPLYVD